MGKGGKCRRRFLQFKDEEMTGLQESVPHCTDQQALYSCMKEWWPSESARQIIPRRNNLCAERVGVA